MTAPDATHRLRGLPSSPPPARLGTRDELIEVAAQVADQLCARALVGGGVQPAAGHGQVALELRHLLPNLDDAEFDAHLARLDRIAAHISSVETSDAEDPTGYLDAAAAAGLDLSDYPVAAEQADDGDAHTDVAAFRSAVVEHWDTALLLAVAAIVNADIAARRLSSGATTHTRTG